MILDHKLISESYFFPRWATFRDPHYVDSNGARLACHFHQPFPFGMTVVHFHGNGETVKDYVDWWPQLMEAQGYNSLLAEYRGYGMSTGKPGITAMLEDAVNIVRASGTMEEKLVFFGRSVGSIYAVHCAAHFTRAAGLILESGIADVGERLLLRVQPSDLDLLPHQFMDAVKGNFDQQKKIGYFKGRTLVLHTRQDALVNVFHAERLHEWANSPKSIRIFDEGGHNDIFFRNREDYLEEVNGFLAKVKL